MTDGHKLYVTVHYAFNYDESHWAHLTQFDILTQFFEHRNGLKGYVEDKNGARIESGSEVDILSNNLYAAFANKDIPKVVEEYLLHFEMYEILAEYHAEPLSEDALEYKQTLIESYDKV